MNISVDQCGSLALKLWKSNQAICIRVFWLIIMMSFIFSPETRSTKNVDLPLPNENKPKPNLWTIAFAKPKAFDEATSSRILQLALSLLGKANIC